MSTISKGYVFGTTELVTNVKLHTLVESATISGIVNAEISATASIVDTKLAQITTTNKVSGVALQENSVAIATNASIVSTAAAKIVHLYSCSAGSISTITGMLTNVPFMLINRSSGASLALLDASPFLLNGNVTPSSVGSNITLVWDGTNYIEIGRVAP